MKKFLSVILCTALVSFTILYGIYDYKTLFYHETSPKILIKYGIIEKEDWKSEEKITFREAFNVADKINNEMPVSYFMDGTEGERAKFDGELSEYMALVFAIRLVEESETCMRNYKDPYYLSIEDAYKKANSKRLIDDYDLSNANETINREEFYELMHKVLFCEHVVGGYAPSIQRYVDRLRGFERSSWDLARYNRSYRAGLWNKIFRNEH